MLRAAAWPMTALARLSRIALFSLKRCQLPAAQQTLHCDELQLAYARLSPCTLASLSDSQTLERALVLPSPVVELRLPVLQQTRMRSLPLAASACGIDSCTQLGF